MVWCLNMGKTISHECHLIEVNRSWFLHCRLADHITVTSLSETACFLDRIPWYLGCKWSIVLASLIDGANGTFSGMIIHRGNWSTLGEPMPVHLHLHKSQMKWSVIEFWPKLWEAVGQPPALWHGISDVWAVSEPSLILLIHKFVVVGQEGRGYPYIISI